MLPLPRYDACPLLMLVVLSACTLDSTDSFVDVQSDELALSARNIQRTDRSVGPVPSRSGTLTASSKGSGAPVCGSAPASMVDLTWSVPDERRALASNEEVTLNLRSRSRSPLRVRTSIEVLGRGSYQKRTLVNNVGVIGASGSRGSTIRVSELLANGAVEPNIASQLIAHAEILDDASRVVARATSAPLYVHGEQQGVRAYEAATFRDAFRSGDIQGSLSRLPVLDGTRQGFVMGGEGLSPSLVSEVQQNDPVAVDLPIGSNNNHTFCMLYHASTVDSGVGEDYYNSTNWWRARGARVRVRAFYWPFPTIYEGYANEHTGCFSFQSDIKQFFVDLYAETRIGQNGNITVRALPSTGETEVPHWTILSSPNLTGGTRYFYGPASSVSNLIAIGNFALYWFDRHAGNRIATNHTVTLYNQACPSIPNNSCNGFGGQLYIHPNSNQRKFLIAHEVGHQMYFMHRNDGSFGSFNCGENIGGSACTYSTGASDNEHSLHSKEWQSCALSEGFAHFVAADVFNNHAQTGAHFHYYKDGYPASVNVENGPTGGDTAFMEANCSGSDTGYGVELDWMRALWDYHTNSGSKPNHASIMSQIESAHNHHAFSHGSAYFRLWDAADQAGFGNRWQDMSEHNGIDHY